ncbi:MAG: hypothetical protein ACLP05_08725 [Candidatus Kryptoniota bacterium]
MTPALWAFSFAKSDKSDMKTEVNKGNNILFARLNGNEIVN